MPQSPKRKRVAAKRKASEIEVAEPTTTAAKKRRTTRAGPPPGPVPTGSPTLENDDESDDDDASSTADPHQLVDAVVSILTVSNDPVAAAAHWANTNTEYHLVSNTSSYAKLCGRDWTYYVKELHVYIGRPPETVSAQGSDVAETPGSVTLPTHIDLGPSKLISRLHAELLYNEEDSTWYVKVYGRNGVKVNRDSLRQGDRIAIRSGDVLEMVGTEMMFVAVQGQTVIHPMFLERLRKSLSENLEPNRNEAESNWPGEHSRQAGRRSSSHTQSNSRNRVNGQAVIAPAPPDFVRPSTPVRGHRTSAQPATGSMRSPAFGRGIVIESSQLIDYSSDSAKDIKPGLSYATMIAQAITSTPDQCISLKGIYDWICTNFSYYRHSNTNWQNSIRHNLSLSAAFMKFPRGNNEPGKGANWCINPEKREELMATAQKQMIKSGARQPSHRSNPSSPAVRDHSASHVPSSSQPQMPARGDPVLKTSPSRRTPPPASYPPIAHESYSPTRGPRLFRYTHSQPLPVLANDPSPLPHRPHNGRVPGIQTSSPLLTSAAWMSDRPMMTPVPRPHNLDLPLPNTAKLPTSHMPDSSPAPFWKYTDQQPLSTPAKWPDSPVIAVGLQSSSPPPAASNDNESPTRNRGLPLPSAVKIVDAEEDEPGIDLTRGFPKISSYHRLLSGGASSNGASSNVAQTM